MTPATVVRVVCEVTGVREDRLRANDRLADAVLARKIAYLAMRDLLHMSYPAIGNALDRDHTSVMSGVNSIRKLMQNEFVRGQVAEVFEKLPRQPGAIGERVGPGPRLRTFFDEHGRAQVKVVA